MEKVYYDTTKQFVPIKSWDKDLEAGALEQAINLSNLPFIFKHVGLMGDCHKGYGMPIGGVIATKDVVIPYAVGNDGGCGMCAVKTSLKIEQLDTRTLKEIMGKIREVIPVGKNKHKERQDPNLLSNKFGKITYQEFGNICRQLGTLGAGNHFIEIQKDTDGYIWIMVHSGSRNVGLKVAEHYNKLAIALNKRWYSRIPREFDLAFLPMETQEAKDYMVEMQYCVDFALANRKLMMQRIIDIFASIYPTGFTKEEGTFWVEPYINIAHNYAAWENHFGQNVIVHRKGATLARKGTIGIIPGCQGTKSYIVRGKGNPESFMSCSHGAGRVMGRNEARKKLNLEDEIKKLDEQGIIHSIRTVKDLDEATSAYKDIDTVMESQKDLVDIVTELRPLGVIKG